MFNQTKKNEIASTVKSMIEEIMETEITMDNNNVFLEQLGITSNTFIKLIVSLEQKFDFEFEDEVLNFAEFDTIQSLIDYVEKRV